MVNVEIKTVKLSSIKLNPDNPRRISTKDMDRLVKSLTEFPDMMKLREIVVDETMTVLGGNMRLLALRKIGAKEATAKIVTGLTPEQKREFVVKDNAAFGQWDFDALANEWSDLPLTDWGVDLPEDWMLGADEGEPKDAEPQIDRAEELNKEWQVKLGDLWQIGEHRLLCGDSTKAEDVTRALGGGSPFMMVTDPPYGVEYDASWRSCFGGGAGLASGKVLNDNRARWSAAYVHSGAIVAYVWHGSTFTHQVALGLESCGFVLRSQIIWKKTNITISRGDYHWAHEACWYAVKKGENGRYVGGRKQRTVWADIVDSMTAKDNIYATLIDPLTVYAFPVSATTIWELPRDAQCGGGHSTQKPLECMARPIRNHGKKGDIIYDPFLGSGTTMVACENLKRNCRAVELSPPYCAVILQRMKDAFPGIEIRRINGN